MQIIFTEYVCDCGVSLEHMLPIGSDVAYKFHLPCPECGKPLYLVSATRMVSQDSESDDD